jgi:type I secretion target GGXGXDXXX repeat protein domain protein
MAEEIESVQDKLTVWRDQGTQSEEIDKHQAIDPIVKSLKVIDALNGGKDTFEKIGEINRITLGNTEDFPDPKFPTLTYDERNKALFLFSKTPDINLDYNEIIGIPLYIPGNDGKLGKITSNKVARYHIKSLTNQLNNKDNNKFLGDQHISSEKIITEDILENNHDGGTILAKYSKTEDFLYGGDGRDYLFGNSGKDLLLGGLDNDHLYGKGGADIIGGNKGNDHLYAAEDEKGMYKSAEGEELSDADKNILVGGEGNDHLYGGAGEDELFGDERLSEGEELKKESYELVGDDYLQGNAGNDNMYGGKGHDTYVIEDKDTIYDVDGGGEIWFVKESGKNISKEKIYGYQAKNFIFDENNKNEEA